MFKNLTQGDIQIWIINLEKSSSLFSSNFDNYYQVLNNHEQERASKFLFDSDRIKFIFVRWALRQLLSQYISIPPKDIFFKYNDFGKPSLNPSFNINFNISHSGNLALIAIVKDQQIGIDLEHIRPQNNLLELVKNFSKYEQIQWFTLHEREKLIGFYRCWTKKEAFVKALGLGLSYSLKDFDICFEPSVSKLLRIDNLTIDRTRWTIMNLDIERQYIVAFAIELPINSITVKIFTFCAESLELICIG